MPRAGVKSAIRVLELLEQFGEAQGPLRLKDVAIRLGYPVSSTAALLKSVADRGYLSFDRKSRQYFPTNKISDLGLRFSTGAIEGAALNEAMEALQRSTQEFVAIGTPNDIYIDYIKSLRSTQMIQLYSPAGTRRLLIQSGMGWILLSRMEETMAVRIYRRTVAAREINSRAFPEAELRSQLRKIRGREYVFTRSSDYVRTEAHVGGAMISMVVPTPPNHRALVLGVGGPADRLEQNLPRIVASMRAEMERLGEIVGRMTAQQQEPTLAPPAPRAKPKRTRTVISSRRKTPNPKRA